jgi:alkylated DNA nucleotide flippase Atl1
VPAETRDDRPDGHPEREGSDRDFEDYVEAVLSVVERIPSGSVTTYGAIAEAVGRGGPRRVGRVMSQYGGSVPWWRVVRADGTLPPSHDDEARARYLDEGTPLRESGRIHMPTAYWDPPGPVRENR